jgi:hypothetical protein
MTVAQANDTTAMQDVAHVPPSGWIERVSGLDLATFVACYRKPRRPVILTDALHDWRACKSFTPEYFLREHADRPVKVRGRDQRLGDVLEQQLASSTEHPGPYPCTLAEFTGLLDDLSPRFAASLPSRHAHPWLPKALFDWVNHLEIFFGGPGGEFPRLHYDYLHMHAWIAQVHGDKEFTLYEPGQESLLYVDPGKPWLSLAEHAPRPDPERYPLLAEARYHTVVLHAGEALFMPCGTWHTARCLNMGITVAFDQLCADNWQDFIRDACAAERRAGRPARARWLRAYLQALGPLLSLAESLGANRQIDWGDRLH